MLCKKCKNPMDDNAAMCEWCGHERKLQPPPPPPRSNSNELNIPNNTTRGGSNNNPNYRPPKPNNYLAFAIISLLLCWPFGIGSILYAVKANSAYKSGNYSEAQSASASAKKWAIWSIFGFIIFYILSIFSTLIK